jgi:hypothetical protein
MKKSTTISSWQTGLKEATLGLLNKTIFQSTWMVGYALTIDLMGIDYIEKSKDKKTGKKLKKSSRKMEK